MANGNQNGDNSNNTQMASIGQLVVQNLGLIAQAITATFPNFVTVPANSTASGVAGQVAFNSTGFFWCYASNSWARATGTTTF